LLAGQLVVLLLLQTRYHGRLIITRNKRNKRGCCSTVEKAFADTRSELAATLTWWLAAAPNS
jgi:hypothetical protein